MTSDDLTAVVELPAALAARGLVFLAADDWERLVRLLRAVSDVDAIGDMQVHRVDPWVDAGDIDA